jgi:hypothetical protein
MNINMSGNGSVTIDGKSFKGNNIKIVNGKVIVDGKTQDGELVGDINVTVHGDVELLENGSGNVTAQNIGEANTGSGDIDCGSVSGSIRTGSGDVTCGKVGGSIRTGSGDVSHR